MTARNNLHTAALDHIGIVVPELDQASQFFEEHFGAVVMFRIDRPVDEQDEVSARLGAGSGTNFALAMLKFGDARLELLQWWPDLDGDNVVHYRAPNLRGSAHVALEVDQVQATIDQMRTTHGVVVLSDAVTFHEGPTPGLTNAFFRTPWGLLIELVSWPRADESPSNST